MLLHVWMDGCYHVEEEQAMTIHYKMDCHCLGIAKILSWLKEMFFVF